MKIGILGGTFDPVHHGHLIVAEYVRETAGLDRVMFVPSCISPHKQGIPVSDAVHRLAMLREAIRSNPFFEVSDIEIERGGVSFTVDTLEALRILFPRDEFFLMIGADNLEEFHTWKEPERLLRSARLIAMNRPGYAGRAGGGTPIPGLITCDVPGIDISGTEIRRRVAKGLPISYLVPSAVARYIEQNRLYRPDP